MSLMTNHQVDIYGDGTMHWVLNGSAAATPVNQSIFWVMTVDSAGAYVFLVEYGEWAPIMETFCESDEIQYCAGNWYSWNQIEGTWVIQRSATSLYFDCTFTECDLSHIGEEATC